MEALHCIDVRMLRLARTLGHGRGAERAVSAFSRLGDHGALWLALGLAGAAVDSPRRARWRQATMTVSLAYAANTAVKLALRRRRPHLPDLPPVMSTPTALSFPSAHATTSFAGARAYAALGLPIPPVYGLAAALSVSRVYLGVHYPSDVVAGALLGTAIAGLRETAPA